MSNTKHQLIQTHKKNWHCQVCLWDWGSEPKSRCPGVCRYNWDTKPIYLVSQTTLKKLGFSSKGDRVGVVCYSHNKCWNLYDIRQEENKNGEHWEAALLRWALLEKKRKQKEALKNAFESFAWQLESLENHLSYIINLLDDNLLEDGRPANRFQLSRPRRIGMAGIRVKFFVSTVELAKLDLIVLQKLIGKFPQPGDAVLGGKEEQARSPKPWDAVLGGKG